MKTSRRKKKRKENIMPKIRRDIFSNGRFSKPHFRRILRYKVVFSNVRCYIHACIWTRGCNASCDAAAATNEGWGPWRVCAPSPYRVYNAPPPYLSPSLHPLSPGRPPSNSPHRPYSPHRYSLSAPLGISQRRCRVLHNSRAPLPVFYRRHATLPSWTGVPCRVRSASACLPVLPACFSTYLSTHQNLAKLTLNQHFSDTLKRSSLKIKKNKNIE